MPQVVSSNDVGETMSMDSVSQGAPEGDDDQSGIHEIKNPIGSEESNKVTEFTTLRNAIKLMNIEAIKAEELYKAESLLLSKANEQLFKVSRLLQEQDAEMATVEEELKSERKARDAAEKHYIKLKKMMVVKDVEVTDAEQRNKAEHGLRKGAEREMSLLKRQLQAKDSQLAALERKYQKECKQRELYESHMMQLSKQAGQQSAEEKYQILQKIRNEDGTQNSLIRNLAAELLPSKENSSLASNSHDRWRKKEEDDLRFAALTAQLEETQDQLKQAESELKKEKNKTERERHLREEADKQLIVMREKGFAYHVDRRTSARTHAEDCINNERLKIRNADLQAQVENLKKEALDLREEIEEERDALVSAEEELETNRKAFQRKSFDYESQIQALQEQLNEVTEKHKQQQEEAAELETQLEKLEGVENELKELRTKFEDYQQQVIDAKAESKKEQTLRSELEDVMKAMENELDSMEGELEATREELETKGRQLDELRSEASDDHFSNLELKEKIRILQEELAASKTQCDSLNEKQQTDKKQTEKLEEEVYKLRHESEESKALFDEANELKVTLEKEIDNLHLQLQNSAKEFELEKELRKRLEEEAFKLSEDLGGARSTLDMDEEIKEKLKEEVDDLQRELEETKQKIESVEAKDEENEKKIGELRKELAETKQKLEVTETQHKKAEKKSEKLRQQVDTITKKLHNAMSQGEKSDDLLKQRVDELAMELGIAKKNCLSLQEKLEIAHQQYDREKELREQLEKNVTFEDRSLARVQREESEQEMINLEARNNAVRVSEDKWRMEKRQREALEEQCRSLREEIYQLKHDSIVSRHDPNGSDMESIARLERELKASEKQQGATNKLLESERKIREDLQKEIDALREIVPEYSHAEEMYQKERKLRAEAEATIEILRREKTASSGEANANVDVMALKLEKVELQQKLASLQSELAEVREQQRRSHQEQRNDEGNQSLETERRMRAKAEKQAMSMRLKVEAKETEIANLKNRLSLSSDANSHSSKSTTSRASRKRFSFGGSKVSSPQLEYRSSGFDIMAYKMQDTYKRQDKKRESYQHHHQQQFPSKHSASQLESEQQQYPPDTRQARPTSQGEIHNMKEEILRELPDYVKNNFGRIGFVKHSVFEYWPALVLDPFTVPEVIQSKWLELFYEFEKRDMFLVYLFGRRHRDGSNAYPIVEPHHFVSYQDGVDRRLDQIPADIEDKLQNGETLTEIEEEYSDGLTQIRMSSRLHPRNRTHPLDERRQRRRAYSQQQSSIASNVSNAGPVATTGVAAIRDGPPSMTSTTSWTSSLGGDLDGLSGSGSIAMKKDDRSISSPPPFEERYQYQEPESPTKRPRSEYSLNSSQKLQSYL